MAAQHPPMTTTDQVYEYFVALVDAMAIGLNKSPVRWEEVWQHFGTQLDQRTVIHAWLSRDALINATSLGYRAIWSVDGYYYLDALNEVWESFYDVDILAGVTNSSAIPLILGGEWTGRGGALLCLVEQLPLPHGDWATWQWGCRGNCFAGSTLMATVSLGLTFVVCVVW